MQTTLFPTVPDHQETAPRPYSIPVYRVTLVRESRLPHTQPQAEPVGLFAQRQEELF